MNKDARVELYFDVVKLCICSAWFFVHLPSHWTKERCVEVGVMYAAPSIFVFVPVKGWWTTNTRKMHKGLCFQICCSHPCFNSKYLFGMDPKVLATILLLLLFSKRENWEERFFLLHTILSKKNSNKAELKMHRHNKEVF